LGFQAVPIIFQQETAGMCGKIHLSQVLSESFSKRSQGTLPKLNSISGEESKFIKTL
jgi:hypothetical protein